MLLTTVCVDVRPIGERTGRTRRRVRRLAGGTMLLVGIATGSLTFVDGWPRQAFARAPGNTSVMLAIWCAWAGIVVALTHRWRRRCALPGLTTIGAVLWGAAAAPALTEWSDKAWAAGTTWTDVILRAPFDEAVAKGIGTTLVLLTIRRPISMRDGLLTGALVGVGFTVVEGWAFTLADGGTWSALGNTLWLRGVSDLPSSHLVFSGITGAGIAAVIRGVHRWRGVSLLALGLTLHMLHNALWSRGVDAAALVSAASLTAVVLAWLHEPRQRPADPKPPATVRPHGCHPN